VLGRIHEGILVDGHNSPFSGVLHQTWG
jgi:hypothetical protein